MTLFVIAKAAAVAASVVIAYRIGRFVEFERQVTILTEAAEKVEKEGFEQ